tara:strand:+ start:3069 stop:3335 length:267 start_codon:yes stop_codon:yes gene_type:complete
MKVVRFLTDWVGWATCLSYGKIYGVNVRSAKEFCKTGASNIKLPRNSPWVEFTRLKKSRKFMEAIKGIKPQDILPAKRKSTFSKREQN